MDYCSFFLCFQDLAYETHITGYTEQLQYSKQKHDYKSRYPHGKQCGNQRGYHGPNGWKNHRRDHNQSKEEDHHGHDSHRLDWFFSRLGLNSRRLDLWFYRRNICKIV